MPRSMFLGLALIFIGVALVANQSEGTTMLSKELVMRIQRDTEKYRKGNAKIVVFDNKGRPIEGVLVKAEQVSHDFLFGCNIYALDALPDANLNEKYKELFKRLLNYATVPFYWRGFEPEQGKPGYARTDHIVKWCKENNITTKGHPLVWTHQAGVPAWLDESNPTEVKQLLEHRVTAIVSRYKGQIDIWDVVNESTHTRTFAGLSMFDYTALPFYWARKANPSATLIVNEFGVVGPRGGDDKFYNLLREMKEKKVPFDVIGIQTHMHRGPFSLAEILDTLDRYATLGKPIHFTETTVLSGGNETTPEGEKKQAEYVEQFYRVCFSHPAVRAITWWDFSDAKAWQGLAAGLVRKDMSPKPVYLVLDRLINKEWHTIAKGETFKDGSFSFRGFYGKYTVSLTNAKGESKLVSFHLREGSDNVLKIRL
ncbi:MAG: endo-1,4-beta-xylanase [Armatimonadota bacterium]|nr:endo-1,4-beta-xylanase [Armatimonadota bacterium]